jgi:hypothetical protein
MTDRVLAQPPHCRKQFLAINGERHHSDLLTNGFVKRRFATESGHPYTDSGPTLGGLSFRDRVGALV